MTPEDGIWGRSVLPGARPGSRSTDQTPQMLRLVGPNPSQRHRQHDRQRHADALPHLGQPANERALEPVGSRQPAVHPLHRAALVVEVLPPVARPRHRREHPPIFRQRYPHPGPHRTLLPARAGAPRSAHRTAVLQGCGAFSRSRRTHFGTVSAMHGICAAIQIVASQVSTCNTTATRRPYGEQGE